MGKRANGTALILTQSGVRFTGAQGERIHALVLVALACCALQQLKKIGWLWLGRLVDPDLWHEKVSAQSR